MSTRYSKRLGEWIEQEELKHRDESLVAFIAVQEDVCEALEAGYSARSVWRNLKATKQIAFGYDTFLKYVNRFLCRPKRNRTSTTAKPTAPTFQNIKKQESGISAKNPVAKEGKPTAVAGFTFNPVPNDKELF